MATANPTTPPLNGRVWVIVLVSAITIAAIVIGALVVSSIATTIADNRRVEDAVASCHEEVVHLAVNPELAAVVSTEIEGLRVNPDWDSYLYTISGDVAMYDVVHTEYIPSYSCKVEVIGNDVVGVVPEVVGYSRLGTVHKYKEIMGA